MAIVFIIGFVQAFFIGIILLNKKNKSLSDKILAIWIFVIGLHLLLFYLDYIDYYQNLPHILGLVVPLPLVQGPLLLLYVISLIKEDQTFNRFLLIHFIPALSFYLFLSPIMLLPAEEKLHYVFEVMPANSPLYFEVFSHLINVSGPIYIIWSLVLLKKHYMRIKDNFSYTEKINLKWLRNLILGMVIIWIAVLFTEFIDEEIGSAFVFSAVTLFVFIIGYYGIRQGVIFADPLENPHRRDTANKEKYKKSPLDMGRSQSLLDRLLHFMEEKKPYLETKITLPQLANQFETNPNYLSQVINEKLNQNFYDFINRYRVEEFMEKLKKEDAMNYTLFGHARDCGFSSKSSFHEVFKKQTGQTPSQFQASLLSATNH
ncbi:MAG: helix-turn-helix transcriptional regulator, partial [Cyclobacteriaceae bacterium]|nr:helix-turn-helix transcriptional regulator [Cyclobacteriaceae bacterium]MCK5470214.1 helix-turn-helix transcriptional regulator [Cyclobacteriaceae bacterium]